MKDEYSFLEEGPWQQTVGNAIGSLARQGSFTNGAVVGAGVGAAGNVVKNAMKRDDDPTKQGVLKSAIKGGAAGAVGGAVISRGLGAVARSNVGKAAQNNLFNQAANQYGQAAVNREIAAGSIKVTDPTNAQQIDRARKQALSVFNSEKTRALNSVQDVKTPYLQGGHWSFRSGLWHGKNMDHNPYIVQA